MKTAIQNLFINQGSTFRQIFILRDSENQLMNLTGYTCKMQARKKIEDPIAILTLTTENNKITLTPLEGKIELYLTDIETSAINLKSLVYDIEIKAPSGDVVRILQGRIDVSFEVTR